MVGGVLRVGGPSNLMIKPKDVSVNFCATQQFSYIFEVAAQVCELCVILPARSPLAMR